MYYAQYCTDSEVYKHTRAKWPAAQHTIIMQQWGKAWEDKEHFGSQVTRSNPYSNQNY